MEVNRLSLAFPVLKSVTLLAPHALPEHEKHHCYPRRRGIESGLKEMEVFQALKSVWQTPGSLARRPLLLHAHIWVWMGCPGGVYGGGAGDGFIPRVLM